MTSRLTEMIVGARPSTLTVEQATTFELVVHLKAADTPSVTISPAVLTRAGRIIE